MDIELQAICSALGYQEGSKYLKEPDCLESVKDLIKCLRRDDDTCSIRRQLGNAEILQSDLLPLLKEYKTDRNLLETVIRLLLNLTQPARLCFGNQLPEDKILRNHYLEVESILRNYKKAFMDDVFFAVLTEKLTDLLKLDWEHRHEEDRMLIERLLILVRNILHVQPEADEEKRTDDDASIHDQVLWSLHVSGMEDLLLYIANSADERQYCMHTLEIISLMFRQQTPSLLASAGVQRAFSEKEKDVKELEIIREQEQITKRQRARMTSTRHSRFGGTFVLKNLQSISENEVIYHRSLDKAGNYSFDITKKSYKTPKNRAPIKQVDVVRRSTLSIRLCLKEFCVQFLENCYNPLMSAVKDNLVREVAQDHDETYYLWALRFFMEFCRLHSQQVELISETLSISAFHYIQVNLLNYYEMIMTDKKEGKVWAKRVHLALKAYQELLMTLHAMEISQNPHLVSSAKVLKGNIFYMMEFRDIFVTLLSKFNHSLHSTSYLTDLVHATHLFLKMLEIAQKSNRYMVVQTKKKKARKQIKKKTNVGGNSQMSEEELLGLWDDVSTEVSAILSGEKEMSEGVLPFDAASEVDIDTQRADTMVRIQTCLRSKNAAEAVALLRAAREVWPDNNEFGTTEMSSEDEFLSLREVFMANLSQNIENTDPSATALAEEEEEPQENVLEEEMSAIAVNEEELNTRDFVAKFAKPTILKSYSILLANFKNNSAHTNHCIIKMFHRIAVDLHQEGMFFQASLFSTFREIVTLSKVKEFQEMVKFGVYIVQKFLAVAEKNKKVFMEMLFWKTTRQAEEVSSGYMEDPTKNIKQLWTEDQEIELRRLFDEAKEDPEKDVMGHIMAHLTDDTKSRGQVIRQLRISGLIESARDLKRGHPNSTNPNRAPWTEEQEIELRNVFEQFRESDDPLGNTMQNLSFTKSKNKIKDKLFGLDIIQDKKELSKKRSKKKKQRRMDESDESGDNGSSSDDDVQEDHVMATHADSTGEESDETEETIGEEQPSTSNNLTNTDIDDVLRDLVNHNYKGPIGWIQRSLRRTAEDRQTPGNYTGVPVVPLTEENEDAMEDPSFIEFLLLIGLVKPAEGQEVFWRISGDLDGPTLTLIADGLNLDENNQPVNTVELKKWFAARSVKSKTVKSKNKPKNSKSKSSINNDKRKKAMMALLKNQPKNKRSKRKNTAVTRSNEDSDNDNNNPGTSKKRRRTKKKKISDVPDEEGEENGDTNSQLNMSRGHSLNHNSDEDENKPGTSKIQHQTKKKKSNFLDDEEGENGDSLSVNGDNNSQQNMSASHSPKFSKVSRKRKKRRELDSSSDEDIVRPLNTSQISATQNVDSSSDEDIVRPLNTTQNDDSSSDEDIVRPRNTTQNDDSSSDEDIVRPRNTTQIKVTQNDDSSSDEDIVRPRNTTQNDDSSSDEDIVRPRNTTQNVDSSSDEDIVRPRNTTQNDDSSSDEDIVRPRNTTQNDDSSSDEDIVRPRNTSQIKVTQNDDSSSDEDIVRPRNTSQIKVTQNDDSSSDEDIVRPRNTSQIKVTQNDDSSSDEDIVRPRNTSQIKVTQNDDSSSDEDIVRPRNTSQIKVTQNDDSSSDEPLASISASKQKTTQEITGTHSKRRAAQLTIVTSSDSDSDDDDVGRLFIETEIDDNTSQKKKKKKTNKKRLLSDSSSEEESNNNVSSVIVQEGNNKDSNDDSSSDEDIVRPLNTSQIKVSQNGDSSSDGALLSQVKSKHNVVVDDDDDGGVGGSSSDGPLLSQVKSKHNVVDDDDDDDDDDDSGGGSSSDGPLPSQVKSKHNVVDDDDGGSSSDEPLISMSTSKKKTTGTHTNKRVAQSTQVTKPINNVQQSNSKKNRKKRLLSDGSSEDEGDNNNNNDNVSNLQENNKSSLNGVIKKSNLQGSNSVKSNKKRQKLLDFESSDEDLGGKSVEKLDKSPVAEMKTASKDKRKKVLILESSDDNSSAEGDKENQKIDSTKEPNEKAGVFDAFDKAQNIKTNKYNTNAIDKNKNSNNPVDTNTFPATLLSIPNMETESNVFDDHVPLVTAIHKKHGFISDDDDSD